MQSEFQKQQKAKKTDWVLVISTIVLCTGTFYLALKCVTC